MLQRWAAVSLRMPSQGDRAHPLSRLQSGDVKATTAVLGFILSRAAKHSIGSESLSSGLQQLGLPKGRGNPQGGTMSQTWWDVAGSSQPCLLHTPMEGRLPAVLSSTRGLLRCFGEVWQLQVWCEQRDSSHLLSAEHARVLCCFTCD